ncbi:MULTISPECIES: uroporphyrinogen-III synthase [Flavobacterium]|uniref:Uroporphyrinogen-III synthase n=1 Tax=Flavobacterium jumunjinense TaxID=998845 RepID=A0ABV5GR27_9FLAO|nr:MULTISPECIES: uroporphyrinogen-III synthase [Flavobacterium]
MITVLATKKLTKTQKKSFENNRLQVVDKNFIKTKIVPFEINILNEILLFTSKNAVKSVLKNSNSLTSKKCICVGSKTKKYLEKKGFEVIDYRNNAEQLANFIITKHKEKTFTFFSGNLRKNDLPKVLIENNVVYNEITVYETYLKPHKLETAFNGIAFFSPSGVSSYLKNNELKNEVCFCIGKTTAKALENKTQNIKIITQPSVENVIEEIIKYYN